MRPDVVFYQQYAVPYFGILSVLAHLKYRGFKADVIISSLEKDPVETLKQLNPRLIGISVTSPEHEWLIRSSQSIRRALSDTPIMAGGVHAIFYAQEILSESCVDLVCNSEGENVIVDVVRELDKQESDWASIPGLSYKDVNNRICHNERAVLVPFDDNIIEDRGFYYDRYSQLAKDRVHRFFSSRGCPFRCSFCYNANIHDIFKGKGEYVRRK
ncbi:MAG: cobalamin-dependent protein, partial [Candidatus Auribacterota bacterium]|nr:cobalamin-dependent protein [Candidatus Auribacterota bacterium]